MENDELKYDIGKAEASEHPLTKTPIIQLNSNQLLRPATQIKKENLYEINDSNKCFSCQNHGIELKQCCKCLMEYCKSCIKDDITIMCITCISEIQNIMVSNINGENNQDFLGIKRENEIQKDYSQIALKSYKKRIKFLSKSRRENIKVKCSACGEENKMNNVKYCSTLNCKEPYCLPCIKSNKEDCLGNFETKWICYKCEESINKNFEKPQQNKMNIIESEQKALEEISDTSKNVIKIDNFVIYEKNDGTNSNDTLTNNENTDKNLKSEGLKENEKLKIQEILKNVEYTEVSLKNAQKICIMCNLSNDYNSLLKFKNLEEFLYFLKYCFLTKYKDYVQDDCPAYEKNKENFFEYLKNYEKYYKSGYIFKSVKYLCTKCFKDTLKQNNGFHTLFNLLHISSSILNSNIVKPSKKTEKLFIQNQTKQIETPQSDPKDHSSWNNYTEIDKSNYNIIISREVLKKCKPNNDIEINIRNNTNNSNNGNNFKNLIEIMKTNVNKLPNIKKTQNGNNVNPPPQVSLNSNIQNMVKMPNNKKINNLSLNLLIGNNNLNFMNNQNPQANLEQNQQKISSNLGKLNELINKFEGMNEVTPNISLPKHDDRENSTINTNNETDKNELEKKKDFGNNVYNILDDLKTQVASMHYYSMVQKYFINYIFKNVESFIEQIAPNSNIRQSLGDIIDNNCSNLLNNYPGVNPNDPNSKNPSVDASNILKKMTGVNPLNLPNFSNLPNNCNLPNFSGLPNIPNMPNIPNIPNLPNNLFNLPNNNILQQMLGNNNNPQNMPDLMTLQSLMNQINNQSNNLSNNNPPSGNNPLNTLFGNMINNNTNSSNPNNNPPELNKNIFSELFKNMEINQIGLNNNIPSNINPSQNNNNANLNFLTPNTNTNINKNKSNNHLINNLIPSQANNSNSIPNNQNNPSSNMHMGNIFPNNFMQSQSIPQSNLEHYQKMLISKSLNGNNNLSNMHNISNLQGLPNINIPILNNNNPSNQPNNNSNNQMGFQELLNSFRNPMGNMMGNPSLNVINQANQGFPQENPFNMGVNPTPNNGNLMNSSFLSHLTNFFNNQNNNNNNK